MDELEKFCKKHHEVLSKEFPGEENWEVISSHLDRSDKKRKFDFNIIWKVAAVLFFCASSYLLMERSDYLGKTESEKVEQQALRQTMPFISETESYYVSLIAAREQEIASFSENERALVIDFQFDMEQLDAKYFELKEELQQQKTAKVLDAMVQNMQLRLHILNQQLIILKKVQNEKNSENEGKARIL